MVSNIGRFQNISLILYRVLRYYINPLILADIVVGIADIDGRY